MGLPASHLLPVTRIQSWQVPCFIPPAMVPEQDWQDPAEFKGCGRFCSDSWRIFCRGHRGLRDVEDRNLQAYLRWLTKGVLEERRGGGRKQKATEGSAGGEGLVLLMEARSRQLAMSVCSCFACMAACWSALISAAFRHLPPLLQATSASLTARRPPPARTNTGCGPGVGSGVAAAAASRPRRTRRIGVSPGARRRRQSAARPAPLLRVLPDCIVVHLDYIALSFDSSKLCRQWVCASTGIWPREWT